VSESLNCSGQALPDVPNRHRFNELASHILIPNSIVKQLISLSLWATAFDNTDSLLNRQGRKAPSFRWRPPRQPRDQREETSANQHAPSHFRHFLEDHLEPGSDNNCHYHFGQGLPVIRAPVTGRPMLYTTSAPTVPTKYPAQQESPSASARALEHG
jgi:hypothetical protein